MKEKEQKDLQVKGLTTQQIETIKLVKDRAKELEKSRNHVNKQNLVNLAFLFNKQYFTVERSDKLSTEDRIIWELKNLERKKKTRRVANYISSLYRSLLARMLSMKANVNVEPTTRSKRDQDSARVSQEVLEDFWQMVNKKNPLKADTAGMLLVLKKLFGYILATGEAYLMPLFNPKTNAKAVFDDEVIEGEIGEVEVEVKHCFDVMRDKQGRFLIDRSILPVDVIKDKYKVAVKPQEVEATDTEKQLVNMLEGGEHNKYKDSAIVYQMWEIASNKYPQGRYIVVTDDRVILDTVIPAEYKGKIPYFRFTYFDILLAPYPQGMVEPLISLQEEYNYTISRLASYKKWFAGKVLMDKNAKVETKIDDEIGQIVKYDGGHRPPVFAPAPNPPSFLMEEVVRIKRDMEDISAVHDASLGRIPAQAKSGKAIENLTEMDNSQLGPVLIGIESQLAFFAETVLEIVEAKYSENRILAITGESLSTEIKTFKGQDVSGNKRIKISLGSSLPIRKSERQEYILLMLDKQLITPDKAKELLEFADIEGIYHNIDEQQEKSEIQEMIKGNVVIVPQPWEEHSTRLKVLSDFLKSDEFKELPEEITNKVIEHYTQHQDFLRQEQEMMKPPQERQQG